MDLKNSESSGIFHISDVSEALEPADFVSDVESETSGNTPEPVSSASSNKTQ